MILQMDITDKCNLRCNFCYNKDILNHGDFLTPNAIKDWYEKIDRRNKVNEAEKIYTAHIGGGEPLLHPCLEEILDFFYKMPMVKKIILSTNGTIWDKNLTYWLRLCQNKNKITIQVSLPAIKNYEGITGHNAANQVLSNIKKYRRICDVQLNMPIYSQNLEDLQSILDFVYQVKLPIRVNKARGIPLGISKEKLEYEVNKVLYNHMALVENWIIKTFDDCEYSKCCRDIEYLAPNSEEGVCPFTKYLAGREENG